MPRFHYDTRLARAMLSAPYPLPLVMRRRDGEEDVYNGFDVESSKDISKGTFNTTETHARLGVTNHIANDTADCQSSNYSPLSLPALSTDPSTPHLSAKSVSLLTPSTPKPIWSTQQIPSIIAPFTPFTPVAFSTWRASTRQSYSPMMPLTHNTDPGGDEAMSGVEESPSRVTKCALAAFGVPTSSPAEMMTPLTKTSGGIGEGFTSVLNSAYPLDLAPFCSASLTATSSNFNSLYSTLTPTSCTSSGNIPTPTYRTEIRPITSFVTPSRDDRDPGRHQVAPLVRYASSSSHASVSSLSDWQADEECDSRSTMATPTMHHSSRSRSHAHKPRRRLLFLGSTNLIPFTYNPPSVLRRRQSQSSVSTTVPPQYISEADSDETVTRDRPHVTIVRHVSRYGYKGHRKRVDTDRRKSWQSVNLGGSRKHIRSCYSHKDKDSDLAIPRQVSRTPHQSAHLRGRQMLGQRREKNERVVKDTKYTILPSPEVRSSFTSRQELDLQSRDVGGGNDRDELSDSSDRLVHSRAMQKPLASKLHDHLQQANLPKPAFTRLNPPPALVFSVPVAGQCSNTGVEALDTPITSSEPVPMSVDPVETSWPKAFEPREASAYDSYRRNHIPESNVHKSTTRNQLTVLSHSSALDKFSMSDLPSTDRQPFIFEHYSVPHPEPGQSQPSIPHLTHALPSFDRMDIEEPFTPRRPYADYATGPSHWQTGSNGPGQSYHLRDQPVTLPFSKACHNFLLLKRQNDAKRRRLLLAQRRRQAQRTSVNPKVNVPNIGVERSVGIRTATGTALFPDRGLSHTLPPLSQSIFSSAPSTGFTPGHCHYSVNMKQYPAPTRPLSNIGVDESKPPRKRRRSLSSSSSAYDSCSHYSQQQEVSFAISDGDTVGLLPAAQISEPVPSASGQDIRGYDIGLGVGVAEDASLSSGLTSKGSFVTSVQRVSKRSGELSSFSAALELANSAEASTGATPDLKVLASRIVGRWP